MKNLNFLFIFFILFLGGCKNPLDQSGIGKSAIDDAYNVLLQLPANFSFSNYEMSSSQVVLHWRAVDRADSYQVKYGTSRGVYSTIASCTNSPCTITGLVNGTTYFFTAIAINPRGSTTVDSELTITPTNTPSIPNGVSAISTNGAVALSWSSSTGIGTIKYKVLRSTTSGSGYNQIATDITGTNYNDGSVINGTVYYYVIRSFNEFGEGTNSTEVSGQAYQNFSLNIPFNVGTTSSYVLSNSSLSEFSSGVFRLIPLDQSDDDSSAAGFGGATLTGTQYDSTNSLLRLNTTTNYAELDSSWTPQWNSLVGYWKMSGSGFISTSYQDAEIGFKNCHAISSGTNSYINGQVQNAINVYHDQHIDCDGTNITNINSSITILGWLKYSDGTGLSWGSIFNTIDFSAGTPTGIMIQRNNLNNYIQIRVDTSAQSNAVCQPGTSDRNILDGNWHHYAFTIGAGTINFYIDGNLSNTCSYSHGTGFASNYSVLSLMGFSNDTYTSHDEIGIFNSVLSSSDVQAIYNRQNSKYSGEAKSRVMDANSTQSWTNLQALTTLPFNKEIAPTQESASSTSGYSDLSTNLNSGLVGLWHLNDQGGTSVVDSSGNGNTGARVGNIGVNDCALTGLSVECYNASGIFNKGFNFVGSTASTEAYINMNSSVTLDNIQSNSSTYSAWVKVSAYPANTDSTTYKDSWGSILIKEGFHFGLMITSDGHGVLSIWDTSNNQYYVSTTSALSKNQMVHLVGIYNRSSGYIYIYLNGKLENSVNVGTSIIIRDYTGYTWKIGAARACSSAHCWPFTGVIDEVAIWSRALSNSEVLQLYRRGANRIKYQIRSCSTSDCSDQDSLTTTYKGWKGPDNTGLTYFSELYNTASNSSTGVVQTANPVMTFSNFSGSGLSVTNNRYFQYRTILESDDENTLCNYGSGATTCSPELKSVTIGPNHYSTSNVYVTSNSGIGSLYQTLSGFTSTLGSNSCTGDRYAISGDGTNFWYYTGAAWALSDGTYAKTSTATQINSNIGTLVAAMGVGTLQVRTYLNSDGITQCEVDNILIQGQKY